MTPVDPYGRRIAVGNNKGGVGKTTLTVMIAEAVAATDRRVLVVDMDPQANATRRLRVDPRAETLAEILRPGVAEGAAGPFIQRCGWTSPVGEYIDVLPAELALEDRMVEAGVPGAVNRLRRALYGVDDGYHLVLFDCPPSMGHLTQQVFAALDSEGEEGRPGDTVIVPLTPERDGIAGALRVLAFLRQYAGDLGVEHLRVAGLIINAVRASTTLHQARVDQLAETFPETPILAPVIPLRARIAEVQDRGEPLDADSETRTTIAPGIRELAAALDLIEQPEVVPA